MMRRSMVLVMLYLGLVAAGVVPRAVKADETPKRIAPYPYFKDDFWVERCYAWTSDHELSMWSTRNHDNSVWSYNIDSGSARQANGWSTVPVPKGSAHSFSGGIGVWIAYGGDLVVLSSPEADLLGDDGLYWCSSPDKVSRLALLDGGWNWKQPVWWRDHGVTRLVELGAGDGGLVLTYPFPQPAQRSRTYIERDDPAVKIIGNIAWPLGCTSQGVVLAIGYWEHQNEKVARLISVDVSKPEIRAVSRQVTPPLGLTNDGTTLCGDKIVWLLRKSTDGPDKSGYIMHNPASHFEIWTSKLDGTSFSRVAQIDTVTPGAGSPSYDKEPQNLQAKPDGTAVSYLQDDSIYLVPIK